MTEADLHNGWTLAPTIEYPYVFTISECSNLTCRFYAILFSFIVSVAGCQKTVQEDLAGLENPPTELLRVAISGDYRPFSQWPETDPEPHGFSPEIIRSFARANRVDIEWVRFRWGSLLSDLGEARFDVAISGITVRPERSIAGLFSIPLTTSGALVLVPETSDLRGVNDLDQPATKLAVNSGGHLERVARQLFSRAQIETVSQNEDVLDRLLLGRVTGVVTDTLEAPHWQDRTDTPLRRIGPLTEDRKGALFVPSKSDWARRFDAWLIEAEASGALARLRAGHGLPELRTAQPTAALLASLDERLTLMTAVAHAKSTLGLAIEDRGVEARVLEVALASVEREARDAGSRAPDRDAVQRLFRAQIEAAKWIQRDELRRERADVGKRNETQDARERARTELDQALRPALLRIGNRIAALVARLEAGAAVSPDFEQTQDALARHGLPESHLRELHGALVSLIPGARPNASTRRPRSAAPDTMPSG
jgi:cyclohexadienyl dehydratase